MLYNLIIRVAAGESGTLFNGVALTYEQCHQQIQRCESLAKTKNEYVHVEMTPVEFNVG